MRLSNRLIDSLPRKERNRILAHCEQVNLTFGSLLCEYNQPISHVYFPLTGFLSLMASVEDGCQPMEIAMVGSEGVLGATLALEIGIAPWRGVVNASGHAFRMSVSQLQREMRDTPSLRRVLNRYLFVLMSQMARITVCTNFHVVEARLARCLLMVRDRVHADECRFSHKLLAEMLGVRRSAVTIAAGFLQQRKIIQYSRGNIKIVDHDALKSSACACYDKMIADYMRHFS